jgi:nanoRNase/pAp phosphatase (c-di-AMP/oligoRNAs hydrolase)
MKAQSAAPRRLEGRGHELLALLKSRQRLLVLTHTNPDPDSLGGAVGLRQFAERAAGIPSTFGLRGRIMRAENQEMVRQLGIEMVPIDKLDLPSFDCVAVVDSQPGFGHTFIPPGVTVDIVVDHHMGSDAAGSEAPAPMPAAQFVDVRQDAGATSSVVTEYLMDLGLTPSQEVATALLYGIRTDTADLSRNVSDLDLRAHDFLFPLADRARLRAIARPDLPLPYFIALREALSRVRLYGHVILCSMGRTPSAEMVAEVADLLLRMQGITAVFCGGLNGTTYHLSVRTEVGSGDAWRLIRDAMAGEEGTFGGHGSVAGGSITLPDAEVRTLKRLERRLERNILRCTGVTGVTANQLRSAAED